MTLFWETGSWIGNQDPVLENRIMDQKPGPCSGKQDHGSKTRTLSAKKGSWSSRFTESAPTGRHVWFQVGPPVTHC